MNERRFELLVTWLLLAFSGWYGIRMHLYPSNAGRVPSVVASIAVVVLIVQLVLMYRRPTEAVSAVTQIEVSPDEVGEHGVLSDMAAPGSVQSSEPEPDTYATLIAVDGTRRTRLLSIVLFSAAFLVGGMLIGFVLTTAVLIAAILLVARERLHVAVIGGLLGGAAAYGLVVFVLVMEPFSGSLIG